MDYETLRKEIIENYQYADIIDPRFPRFKVLYYQTADVLYRFDLRTEKIEYIYRKAV